MRPKLHALILIFTGCIGCSTVSDHVQNPNPTTSQFFTTRGGGFAVRLDDHHAIVSCHYSLVLALRKSIVHPIYLLTSFENPTNSECLLFADTEVQPGKSNIVIDSPEVMGFKDKSIYNLAVYVFDTPNHNNQIGFHAQAVRYTRPKFVAEFSTQKNRKQTGKGSETVSEPVHAKSAMFAGTLVSGKLFEDAKRTILLASTALTQNCHEQRTITIEHSVRDAQGLWLELWRVECCGTVKEFRLIFTPTPGAGGTDINVQEIR